MADTLAMELKTSLTWLFQDTTDLATISDSSKLEYAKSFSDGVTDGQADKLWHDQRAVAAGANDDLDLTDLSQTLFGGSFAISLAKVKAILIVNVSAIAGEDLLVGAAASNAWGGPFDGSQTARVSVPADSALLLLNKHDGWAVTNSSADILRIANDGVGAITYKIVIVGTSS